jgi:hypothetical protein
LVGRSDRTRESVEVMTDDEREQQLERQQQDAAEAMKNGARAYTSFYWLGEDCQRETFWALDAKAAFEEFEQLGTSAYDGRILLEGDVLTLELARALAGAELARGAAVGAGVVLLHE